MRIAFTDNFHCSAERLWTFIEEPEKQKLWMKGVKDNQRTSEGPQGVGSTFRMTIQEGGKVTAYDGTVTAYDRPRHIAVDLSGPGFPCGAVMHVDYQLTEQDGQTRLDYLAGMDRQHFPWWLKLLMPLFGTFARWQLKGFMKTLKRLAEAPEPARS